MQETTLYGVTNQINEPIGVIGIVCPDDFPLLGLVSLMMPAVVRGNAVVVVPSERHPLCATDLYQVLETSDLPPGVINIVTGQRDLLSRTLVDHQDVHAMWYSLTASLINGKARAPHVNRQYHRPRYFGPAEGAFHVEYLSAKNMKRTFVSYSKPRDWFDVEQGEGHEFLLEACQCKNVWIPMGA